MQEHQAAAQAEQLEALRVQAGLQTQALVQLAGGGDSASRQKPRIHLPKMTAEDDAQAFLEAFEVAAEACHWPREEWVVRLLPLLSGEAQQAAHSLPPSARGGLYQTSGRPCWTGPVIAPRNNGGGSAIWAWPTRTAPSPTPSA